MAISRATVRWGLLLAAGLCGGCGLVITDETDGSGGMAGAAGDAGAAGGGGATTGTGSQGVPAPYSLQREGMLAPFPLAVDGEGHAWLWSGTVKMESSGDAVWQTAHLWKVAPDGGIDIDMTVATDGVEIAPQAIAADAGGGVILLGHARASAPAIVSLGGKPVEIPQGFSAFVARLDAGGSLVHHRLFSPGDAAKIHLGNAGVDGSGRVFLSLMLDGTASLGGDPVTATGAVVVVLGPGGEHLEDRSYSPHGTAFMHLAVEPSGRTWLARASFLDALVVESRAPDGAPEAEHTWGVCWTDGMAFAPDGEGGFFAAVHEDPGEQCDPISQTWHVASSGSEGPHVPGGSVRFQTLAPGGPGRALMGRGVEDVWVAEVDAQGTFFKSAEYGGPGEDDLVQLAEDPSGARLLAGHFAQSIDFGQGPLTVAAGQPRQIYLARIP